MKDKRIHILIENLKNDEKDALEVLYNEYKNMVYSVAFSITKNKESSEDVVQNVFIKLLKLDKKNLPTHSELTWLYEVSKNETINYIKKNKDAIDIENIYNITEDNNDLNDVIDKDYYNRIIKKLKPKEQEIVSLKILSDRSFKQISQMLGIPISTVQWKYYKAMGNLKLLISNLSLFIISLSITITSVLNKKINGLNNKLEQEQMQISKTEKDKTETNRTEINKIETDKVQANEKSKTQESKISAKEDAEVNQEEKNILEDLEEKNMYDIENNENDENSDITKNETTNNSTYFQDNLNTQNEVTTQINQEIQSNENNNFLNQMYIITGIFFITTIISYIIFIKVQQKIKKKLSK